MKASVSCQFLQETFFFLSLSHSISYGSIPLSYGYFIIWTVLKCCLTVFVVVACIIPVKMFKIDSRFCTYLRHLSKQSCGVQKFWQSETSFYIFCQQLTALAISRPHVRFSKQPQIILRNHRSFLCKPLPTALFLPVTLRFSKQRWFPVCFSTDAAAPSSAGQQLGFYIVGFPNIFSIPAANCGFPSQSQRTF